MLIQEESSAVTSILKIPRIDIASNSDFHLNTTMLGEDNTPLIILNTSRSIEQ